MKIFLILAMSAIFLLNSCGGVKYSPARDNPTKGEDRARKNVEEGRGISIGGGLKRTALKGLITNFFLMTF